MYSALHKAISLVEQKTAVSATLICSTYGSLSLNQRYDCDKFPCDDNLFHGNVKSLILSNKVCSQEKSSRNTMSSNTKKTANINQMCQITKGNKSAIY